MIVWTFFILAIIALMRAEITLDRTKKITGEGVVYMIAAVIAYGALGYQLYTTEG